MEHNSVLKGCIYKPEEAEGMARADLCMLFGTDTTQTLGQEESTITLINGEGIYSATLEQVFINKIEVKKIGEVKEMRLLELYKKNYAEFAKEPDSRAVAEEIKFFCAVLKGRTKILLKYYKIKKDKGKGEEDNLKDLKKQLREKASEIAPDFTVRLEGDNKKYILTWEEQLMPCFIVEVEEIKEAGLYMVQEIKTYNGEKFLEKIF